MHKLTPREREELADAESEFPGFVRLISVTRFGAILEVRTEEWVFVEDEGAFYLRSKMDPERVPAALFRLAFLRAREAVAAVREGHARASARKRARTGHAHSKKTERILARVGQRTLPFELHTQLKPRRGRSRL
ncbi:MAG: hypothetical protein RLZZ416_137 [Candidatus Parcubacteria bacterium]|jgi:hypothetical protein